MPDTGIPDRSKVIPVSWMRPVTPVNGGQEKFYMMAELVDEPGRMIVVDHSHGAAWNYCKEHNAVYPINARCPLCAVAEVAQRMAVQPLNGHD